SSGQTIYDPAITNTTVDQQQGVFDPTLTANNTWSKTSLPTAVFNPLDPRGASIFGDIVQQYKLDTTLSKKTITGGMVRLGFSDMVSHVEPSALSPLNPENQHATTLSLTQPLLQGAGVAANLAPIVVARINTERSFFQLKDSTQESVRGVVEAYWALVFART